MDNRKFIALIVTIIALFFSFQSHAANISGMVKKASGSPANNAKIFFDCSGSKFNTQADKYGRYRVTGLPNVKWCYLKVSYNNLTSNAVKINSGSGSKDINVKLNKGDNAWRITF